jgi:hypothetical protein
MLLGLKAQHEIIYPADVVRVESTTQITNPADVVRVESTTRDN